MRDPATVSMLRQKSEQVERLESDLSTFVG